MPRRRRGDGGFEVMLASSGRVIKVAPDRSVVQALAEAGVRRGHLPRAGRVRHLLDAGAGSRASPITATSTHAAGAGRERPVPALLFARQVGASGVDL